MWKRGDSSMPWGHFCAASVFVPHRDKSAYEIVWKFENTL
jgi:hypothetical protein